MSRSLLRRAERASSLRRRLLAGAMTGILALGMSLGGAGTAFASVEPTAGITVSESPGGQFTCASISPSYTKSDTDEESGAGSFAGDWGSASWTEDGAFTWSVAEGFDVDFCIKGSTTIVEIDTSEINSEELTGSTGYAFKQWIGHGISHAGFFVNSVPDSDFCDPSQKPGGVSIAQWLADNNFNGADCFTLTEDLQCGSFTASITDGPYAYAYQYLEGTDQTPVYPASSMPATFGEDYNGGSVDITVWIVGPESDYITGTGLPNLWDGNGRTVTVNTDCEPPTLPSIEVSAAFTPMTCEQPTGSFQAGTLDPSDANADKLLWTTTQGTVPSASDNAVTVPGTVTVTVRLKDEFVGGDYAVSDATTLGTVSVISVGGVETALITYTFQFSAPTECDEVIPVVNPFSYVDDCLLGGSYTLEYVEGITYHVTVNDEAPFEVDFGGETTKTYAANQGDDVSVEPVANDGYVLHPDQPKPFERTFSTYGEGDCQLPEFPNWPASASATDEACTPLGVTDGSITVQFSIGPVDNPNPVRYYLAYGTPQQQELTSIETAVPAGDYVVTAAVDPDSTDSINDAGQTAVFELTVGAADESDCDLPTLALTGASDLTGAFGLAALLITLTGMGMVVARRRVEA